LRRYRTPGLERLDTAWEHKLDVPGRFAKVANVHIGRLLWLMRMSRMDLLQPLLRLQRRQTSWSLVEDAALHRLYCYVWHTRSMGLWVLADTAAVGQRKILVWSDADHSNDALATANSTSAGYVGIGATRRVKAPLDWRGHTQGSVARNTAEAETTSCSDTAFGLALPVQETIAQATGQVLPIIHGVDNAAMIAAVEKGHSRKLAYMRRHQRVSLTSLHDVFVASPDGNKLVKEPSGLMVVDQFTKPLPVELHERGLRLLGLGYFEEGPPGLPGSKFTPEMAAREELLASTKPSPASEEELLPERSGGAASSASP
jgi:hypothetical protein